MKLDSKLLVRLRAIDEEAAERFPEEYVDAGLGAVGLILLETPENYGYDETPKNSIAFAHTGMGGVHYSFLSENGTATDTSPIVMTVPGEEIPNCIVGENLMDFLRLGCLYGYDLIQGIRICPEEQIPKYSSINEKNDERCNGILDYLTRSLEIAPWDDGLSHFNTLQASYAPKLDVPDAI